MEQSTESGFILREDYSSLPQDIQMPASLANTIYINPQGIDHLVEMELNRIKENYLHSEQQYVEQMLFENPIIIERRPTHNCHYEPISDEEVDVVSVDADIRNDNNKYMHQYRADACRRSRYNNKVKIAKLKYRHKYMSQKLLQSSQMFDCIQDLLVQAEKNLLTQGLSRDDLQHLRNSYGVDKAIDNIKNLEYEIRMEN